MGPAERSLRRAGRRVAGTSLLELMLVLVVLGILVAFATPRFDVAVEQTRVDQAAAALRSLWLAERLNWLEHQSFSTDLDALADQRFIDQAVVAQTQPFVFSVDDADAQAFAVTAQRTGSTAWSGSLGIDESGAITGSTQDEDGHVCAPAP